MAGHFLSIANRATTWSRSGDKGLIVSSLSWPSRTMMMIDSRETSRTSYSAVQWLAVHLLRIPVISRLSLNWYRVAIVGETRRVTRAKNTHVTFDSDRSLPSPPACLTQSHSPPTLIYHASPNTLLSPLDWRNYITPQSSFHLARPGCSSATRHSNQRHQPHSAIAKTRIWQLDCAASRAAA